MSMKIKTMKPKTMAGAAFIQVQLLRGRGASIKFWRMESFLSDSLHYFSQMEKPFPFGYQELVDWFS